MLYMASPTRGRHTLGLTLIITLLIIGSVLACAEQPPTPPRLEAGVSEVRNQEVASIPDSAKQMARIDALIQLAQQLQGDIVRADSTVQEKRMQLGKAGELQELQRAENRLKFLQMQLAQADSIIRSVRPSYSVHLVPAQPDK